MQEIKEIMKAGVSILMDTVLDLLQKDAHSWSTRPCGTCKAISSIIDKPFGCYQYKIEWEARHAQSDKNNRA